MPEKLKDVIVELAAERYEENRTWAFEGGCLSDWDKEAQKQHALDEVTEMVKRILNAERDD